MHKRGGDHIYFQLFIRISDNVITYSTSAIEWRNTLAAQQAMSKLNTHIFANMKFTLSEERGISKLYQSCYGCIIILC